MHEVDLLCCCDSSRPSLLSAQTDLFAWGRDGHAIIAQIAEARLTPQAKAGVEELLGKRTMSSVASWADTIRKDREETSPWHYVNIPYEMRGYDPARDGKNGENVIDKIVDFANVLNDRKRPEAEREEALKFLIHFVGDLHQPLHCSERNEDRGGNFRLVFFLEKPEAISLHRAWDSEILEHIMKTAGDEKLSTADYAQRWPRTSPRSRRKNGPAASRSAGRTKRTGSRSRSSTPASPRTVRHRSSMLRTSSAPSR